MIDVVANEIKAGTLQEILYADDIVLIADTVAELPERNPLFGKVHLRAME